MSNEELLDSVEIDPHVPAVGLLYSDPFVESHSKDEPRGSSFVPLLAFCRVVEHTQVRLRRIFVAC